ncbi:MAG: rhombosortase [Gammaproteobacteria bacterium]|nr:rhombosortase [Gammaproteobacteria bacterium]
MNRMLTGWIKQHVFWLTLLLACLLFQTMGLIEQFRFDRALIQQGDYWLMLSGHFVHLNWHHLWLNLAGLALVMVFFGRYCSMLAWSIIILLSAISVSLGLYWFNQDMFWYVGLSGVLHGLFVVGAWREYAVFAKSGLVLMLLIAGKLLWEQLAGPLPGSESMTGGHVAVDAHLYGAIGGLIFLLLHQVIHIDDWQQNRKHNHQHDDAHENNQ